MQSAQSATAVQEAVSTMQPELKNLIYRLSPEGLARFRAHIGIEPPPLEPDPRRLARSFENDFQATTRRDAQQEAETIAGQIKRLTEAADVCEEALRDTCFPDPSAYDIVRRDAVVEDRALDLLLDHPDLFRRACNVALGISLAENAGHTRFSAPAGTFVPERLDAAANAIRTLLQERFGGHRVVADCFEVGVDLIFGKRWHIALYIERAAVAAIEFHPEELALLRRIQRPVHEVSIDFREDEGQLDISGNEIIGMRAFQQIAQRFSDHALSGAELEPVRRHTWRLDRFRSCKPELPVPPAPFSTVRVRDICLGSLNESGGRSRYSVGQGGNVYDWLKQCGVSEPQLRMLQVLSVELEFETLAGPGDFSGDTVRMTLSSPNSRTFANASPSQREALSEWVVSGTFHAWCNEHELA